MNLLINREGTIIVTVSRRNLRTLLLKLDEPSSQKRLCRSTEYGDLMIVAEEDDVHYGDRKPGRMHPREEEKLCT